MKKYKVLVKLNNFGNHSKMEGKTGSEFKMENIVNVFQEFIVEVENELYDDFWVGEKLYTIVSKEEIKDK